MDAISDFRKNILTLANGLGFVNLEERDVIDLLDADREPLSYEELIQLDTDVTLDEEPVPPACPKLRLQKLSNALSHIEQAINLFLQNDPDVERSAKVCRGLNATINGYKELENEARSKAKQATMETFFKPS